MFEPSIGDEACIKPRGKGACDVVAKSTVARLGAGWTKCPQSGIVRRGTSMTSQCEFDKDKLTVRSFSKRQGCGGNAAPRAATPQTHRPHQKRTHTSIESGKWEGRGRDSGPKAGMGGLGNSLYSPTSPVSWRWHVWKVIESNSGEHTASSNLIIKSSNVNMGSEVAHPITQRGNGGNALCVVGIVRSTDDSEDSITSQEGRDHTRNTIAHNSGETHSRKGRRS